MAADGGGNFGGNGSVSWKVISGDDDDTPGKHDCKKNGNRRNCYGVDKDFGSTFRISLRAPSDRTARAQFIQTLHDALESDDNVEIELPIEDGVANQIVIRWGTASTTTAT